MNTTRKNRLQWVLLSRGREKSKNQALGKKEKASSAPRPKMPNSEAGRVSGTCHRTEWVKRPWTFRSMEAWDHLKIRYL